MPPRRYPFRQTNVRLVRGARSLGAVLSFDTMALEIETYWWQEHSRDASYGSPNSVLIPSNGPVCNCRGRCRGHAQGKTEAQKIAEASEENRLAVAAVCSACFPDRTYDEDFRITPEEPLRKPDTELRRRRILALNEVLAASAEAQWSIIATFGWSA